MNYEETKLKETLIISITMALICLAVLSLFAFNMYTDRNKPKVFVTCSCEMEIPNEK